MNQKNTKFVGGGISEYSAPVFIVVDVAVEQGFAATGVEQTDWGFDETNISKENDLGSY